MDQGRLAEGRAQAEAIEGRDHRRALRPEQLEDVVEDLVAAAPAEVEVDVGSIAPRRVEEALEGQPVAEGVRVREPEAVGHQAVRGRAAPNAGDALRARERADPLHQEEVGGEAEPLDRAQLVVQPVQHLGAERAEAPPGAVEGERAQPRVGRLAVLQLDLGEVDPSQGRGVAAVGGDHQAAGEGGRELGPAWIQLGERLAHPSPRRVVQGPSSGHVRDALHPGRELVDRGQVGGATRQPLLGQPLEQGPVLDGDAHRVVLGLLGVQVPGVRRDEQSSARRQRGLEQGPGRGGRRRGRRAGPAQGGRLLREILRCGRVR